MDEWSLVVRATELAICTHRLHRRRGDPDAPLLNHVAEVAMLLAGASQGTDPVLIAAGWLHELPAKSSVQRHELQERFGVDVATVVFEAFMSPTMNREYRRKEEIDNAPRMSARARQLKLADKTSSVRSLIAYPPPGWKADDKNHYLDWADDVARGCAGVNSRLDTSFAEAVKSARRAIALHES